MCVCAPLNVSTVFEHNQVPFLCELTRQTDHVSSGGLNAAHCECVNDTVISAVCHCGRVLSSSPWVVSASYKCRAGGFVRVVCVDGFVRERERT